jgi:NTE family protein
VTVKTTEKPWSNVLRVGFSLAYDFAGDNDFSLLVDYTMRDLNRLGAEWKNQIQIGRPLRFYSEFYQPFDYSRFSFVMPRARFRKDYFNVFDGKQRVAQYQVRTYDIGLDVGIEPWTYGQATVGILFGGANAKAEIGQPEISDNYVRRGALTGALIADQFDSVTFPHQGYFGTAVVYSSLKALGADDPYNLVRFSLSAAYTRGKNTILTHFRAGTYIGNNLPQYDLFPLGGFLNLSGLSQNQLVGQQFGFASLVGYRQLGKSLLGALYVGGSVEAGNVWKAGQTVNLGELVYAGSAFVGADTPIGPLYLAYGHAEGGFNAVYLFLGTMFRAER